MIAEKNRRSYGLGDSIVFGTIDALLLHFGTTTPTQLRQILLFTPAGTQVYLADYIRKAQVEVNRGRMTPTEQWQPLVISDKAEPLHWLSMITTLMGGDLVDP